MKLSQILAKLTKEEQNKVKSLINILAYSQKIENAIEKYKNLIKKAQEHYNVSDPLFILEMWNTKDHHGGLPHRYDKSDKECAYCLRPKDWKPIKIERTDAKRYEDVYDMLIPFWAVFKNAQKFVKNFDSETKAEFDKCYDAFIKLHENLRKKAEI